MVDFDEALKLGAYVELSLGCRDVPRLDVLSKSDPFCRIYTKKTSTDDTWRHWGTTETVFDTSSCDWIHKIPASAVDGTVFRFTVYDRDSEREDIRDHDLIGSVEVSLQKILKSPKKLVELSFTGRKEKLPVGSRKENGTMIVSADAVVVKSPNIGFNFQVALESSVRSKYYYQITKLMPHGGYAPVFRSDLLKEKECFFKPVSMKASTIAASAFDRPVRIELYQHFPNGRSKAVGYVKFCLQDLKDLTANKETSKTEMKWITVLRPSSKKFLLPSTSEKSNKSTKVFVESAVLNGADLYRFSIVYG
eukprot:Plantae.Rhodophyta-Palmaria_palmata.ctg7947.p1 GENE.Plantae.Rhodophyta-Palmaria_palmata.ctg7947~~Plantae.Rhodophyta-Palmaria_palmata.ctg7947.p1  ORF type:complete len:307 (+),score=39.50 Plantae.Rhodophyta-Palmaria_palmata.ctg7947:234-1154(+)